MHAALTRRARSPAETTTHLVDTICPALMPGQAGPRFYGLITGGVTPAAHLADMLVSSYDPCVQVHWPEATASVAIENLTLAYLLSLLSLPAEIFTQNTITTGATASNILGLALGRDWTVARIQRTRRGHADWSVPEDGLGGVEVDVLVADAHASVKKAAAIVGIGRRSVIDLGDREKEERGYLGSFDLERLEERLKRNDELGRASIVAVSFGEVNTGAIASDTPAVRALCTRYHAHLHIDAAFAAFAPLNPSFAHYGPHLALADSITSDAHKWLNVPYDCGLFFSRKMPIVDLEGEASLFALTGPGANAPAYLASAAAAKTAKVETREAEFPLVEASKALPSPLFMNIENSRRFRALPLYASLLSLGKNGYASLVQRNIAFARLAEQYLRSHPAFDVLTPEPLSSSSDEADDPWRFQVLNIVLFAPSTTNGPRRFINDPDSFLRELNETRECFFTPTVWRGRKAVRMAVSNWMTGLGVDDLEESEEWKVVKGVFERVAKAEI
ncbi:PLP-dependent transferase [Rhodotorula sp. JG-1b]|nr:PLP-dependent transferase [Rhodotorula sp. JG-1b]